MRVFQGIPFYNYFLNRNDYINKKVFSHYKHIQKELLKSNIDLILGFIGSENSRSFSLVEPLLDSSTYYFEFSQENKLLVDKFNYCFEMGKVFSPDLFCISGSNDMVTEKFYKLLEVDKDMSGVGWMEDGVNYIINMESREGFLSKGKYPHGIFSSIDSSKIQLVGGIYALSKKFLELCDWKPFSLPYDEVGMEYSIYSLFKEHDLKVSALRDNDLKLYNIKGNCDLTGYDMCKQIHFYRSINGEEMNNFLSYWESL